MVEEPAKKFAVGDMPPSPTTSNPISNTTPSHKKPTRHHVKRRSSGRVHVTKLAPMARAHTPQPTTDDDNFEDVEQQQQQQHVPRKPMKRSHSSKSIHRLSSNDPHRKVNLSGFTMTSKPTALASTTISQTAAHDSPPITPTEQQSQQKQQNAITSGASTAVGASDSTCVPQVNTKTQVSATPFPPTKSLSTQKSKPITSPTFQVSHQAPAAPLAHILNATANTLVTPDKPALANLTTSSTTTSATASTGPNDNSDNGSSKSKHLYSRFVQQQRNRQQESIEDHQQQQTYRKHQQHEQLTPVTSTDDLVRVNLAIASENMDKEYQIIQDYQDPMVASLARCMYQRQQQQQQQQQKRSINNSKPTSTQLQLHRLAQMGAQQRTFSSSILPTMATLSLASSSSPSSALLPSPTVGRSNLGMTDGTSTSVSNCQQQHTEHRQMARQRHQRLRAVHLSSTGHYTTSSSSSSENKQAVGRWSAGAFLDRMFYGTS